jgi:hypothetical protein
MDSRSAARIVAVASRQHGVVSRRDALRCGLEDDDVRALRRHRQWRRLFRDTYLVDADFVGDVPRSAWLSAALLTHGPRACLVGPTAAELHGLQGMPRDDPMIWVGLLPNTSRLKRRAANDDDAATASAGTPSRLVVRQLVVNPDELTVVDGLLTTVAWRPLADTALRLDRAHALSMLDSALNVGKLTPDDMVRVSEVSAGRRGGQRLRTLFPLVDGRAQSPLESRIRLACIDGGVSPDDLQYAVRDRWGQLLGIADMAWWRGRSRPLVVEADGVDAHSQPAALFRDRQRANDFTLADVDVIRFTWSDSHRPTYVAGVVRRGLLRDTA